MFPRQQQPQEPAYAQQQQSAAPANHGAMPVRTTAIPPTGNSNPIGLGMPDLITAAFNQAVQPYTEKIEQLESQLADMQAWVDQLEQQRAEVHNWIDKRGLRPGMRTTSLATRFLLTSSRRPRVDCKDHGHDHRRRRANPKRTT